ncbi:MAG TPA: hypothetical protein VFU22_12805 [Roseiflexaceae bacterium]|nr:hypothetical protein [Roseiflexaceae bacterium]
MRRALGMKRSMMAAVALFLLSLLPTWAIYGQQSDPNPTWGSLPRAVQPVAVPATRQSGNQSAPAAVTGPFLPVILTSIRVTPIVFTGSTTSDCQGTTGTSFSFGIKYLCVDVIVGGAQDQQYKFRWTINGQLIADEDLGASGTIGSQLVGVGDGICYGPEGNCGEAIPRGTYQVSFFLNNVQYQTNTAVIR